MAVDLAKLVVKLEAQSGKYQKELEKANSKLSRFERNTKKSVGNIKRDFAQMAGIIGVGALFKAVTAATVKQEAAVRQLKQGIESTGGAVGYTLAELTKKAADLQKVTNFGDEEFIAAQSQLVTFTKIAGNEFDRTIELAADLSTRFGTDLKSSVIQLGKALNDPVANLSALSRAGIQFSNDQKAVIKALVDSGRQVDAQKIILKELEVQFGGSARAARDTFGGALAGLKNAAGDLLEADGASLPALKEQIETLTTLLQDEKTVEGVQKLTTAFLTLGTVSGEGLTKAVGLLDYFGDGIAARISGPAADDIVRIEEEIERVKTVLGGGLEGLLERKITIFGPGGLFDTEDESELKAALARLEIMRDSFYKKQPLGPLKRVRPTEGTYNNEGESDEGKTPEVENKALTALRDSLRSEEQVINDSYDRRKAIVDANTDVGSELRKELHDKLLDEKTQAHYDLETKELEHLARLGDIQARWAAKARKIAVMGEKQKRKAIIGEMIALTEGGAQQSRKMFEINKALSLANALLATPEAVSGAYAFGAKIGGPYLGAAFGALAFANQMSQVNAIRSTSFTGGGGGTTPSRAGTVPVINDTPVITPTSDQGGALAGDRDGGVNITIYGDVIGNDGRRVFEELKEAINEHDEILILSSSLQGQALQGG